MAKFYKIQKGGDGAGFLGVDAKKSKRERRRTEGPQFQVTGTHVIIFVTALLTVAYFAGLLPDP